MKYKSPQRPRSGDDELPQTGLLTAKQPSERKTFLKFPRRDKYRAAQAVKSVSKETNDS